MSIHEQIEETNSRTRLGDRSQVDPQLREDEADPTDTTSILSGVKAIVGKAAQLRTANAHEALAVYEHARQERDEREAQEARELAHLAEWNKRNTVVCGVEMTNAEAQDARRRVIDNDEAYAKWAVEHRHIGEDEEESFKRWMRRKVELEDKRGRGTITADEDREEITGNRSRVGKAMDAATATDHRAWTAKMSALPSENKSTARAEASSALEDYAALKSAPPRQDDSLQQGAKSPVAASIKATGLDL